MFHKFLGKLLPLLVLPFCLLACSNVLGSSSDSDSGFSVTYNGNGGTSGSVPTDSYAYAKGETVTVKANSGSLAKTGFVFAGWNTAADGSGTTYLPTATFAMGSANVVLYAKWTSSSGTAYSVIYNGNSNTSGSVPTDSSTYVTNAVVTVLGNTGSLVRTGYVFMGWNTAADGSGTTYTASQTFAMGSANVTLYAYWMASGSGLWVKTVSTASGASSFETVARDSSGNFYTVGYLSGSGTFTFGSVSVNGTYSGFNAYILKSDSSGTPLWARSVSAGSSDSYFIGVTTDSSGNAYAVGYIAQNGTYTFGGYSLSGPCSTGTNPHNAVIVKYDPSGTVLWAKTVDSATGDGYSASSFQDVKIDSSGNVYVAGWIYGTRTYTFGSQTVTGAYEGTNSFNSLLLKLNPSDGSAVWAKSVGAGAPNYSRFVGLAIDSSNNIYVAGSQYGIGAFTYGSVAVNEASSYASGTNALVAKYDSSGNAVWAKTVSAGSNTSSFSGIAVDGSGGVFAAGSQNGNGTFTYGGVSVTEAGAYSGGNNAVLVKYDASTGAASWAKSVSAAAAQSSFFDVAVDASGNAYVVGYKNGTTGLTLGGFTVTGTGTTRSSLFAKYDASGTAKWVQSVTSGTGYSYLNGALADSAGSLYLAGQQYTREAYTYGGASASGDNASGSNAVLVKLVQ